MPYMSYPIDTYYSFTKKKGQNSKKLEQKDTLNNHHRAFAVETVISLKAPNLIASEIIIIIIIILYYKLEKK